jgi:diazepam-binding inhibitor (GABA receptor modulating acyl-CoA-binding protein)
MEDEFKLALKYIKYAPKSVNVSDLQRLEFYKYYKQATEGDNNEPAPSMLQFRDNAKWRAWNSLKGSSRQDAMKNYVKLLEKQKADWKEDAKILRITLDN